jgi:outer membrane protein OmpA-like peptidoglycan-associated protein
LKLIQFDKDYKADTILIQKSSSLFYPLQSETYYTVKVNGLNYLSQEESFKVSPKDTLISLVMEMQNVTIGTLFELKKVYFTGGTANFTGNSSSALRKLVQTLKDNPNLKVEIQGHVNLPKGSYRKKTEEYYNQLSIDRAKAVYDYLIMRGIEIDRLEYQGYGYSKMVFPEATTADEMQQNRRVELKVIDN